MPVRDGECVHGQIFHDMDLEIVNRFLYMVGQTVCKHLDRPGDLRFMDDEVICLKQVGEFVGYLSFIPISHGKRHTHRGKDEHQQRQE